MTEPEAPSPPPSAPANAVFDEVTAYIPGRRGDAELRRIRRRLTPTGRILIPTFILGALGLGWMYWTRSHAWDARMRGVEAAGEQTSVEAMLTALRGAYAGTSYPDVHERILNNLGHYRDVKAVPIFVQALGEAGIVRRAAAMALARVGLPGAEPAREPLLRVLPKTDERDHAQVVWALAVLEEPRAADAVLDAFKKGLLQAQPDFDAHFVTKVLGTERLGSPELVGSSEPAVRVLVARALGESEAPSALGPLLTLVADPVPDVAREAAAALARLGTPPASDALNKTLATRPELHSGVLETLRRTVGAPALGALLDRTTDRELRRALSAMLRDSHDPRGADALVKLAEDNDAVVREHAAIGLGLVGDPRGAAPLLDMANEPDEKVARAALTALRSVATPSLVPSMIALLRAYPGRRAAILRVFGDTGSPQAGPLLERELGGTDVTTACLALGDLAYAPALPRLMKLATRPPSIDFAQPTATHELLFLTRQAAINGLARYASPGAAPLFIRVLEDVQDDMRLREAAADALSLIADAESIRISVARITASDLPEVTRTLHIRSLWDRQNPQVSALFTEIMARADTPEEVRRAAAIGASLAPSAFPTREIIAGLASRASRRDAALAVTLGGDIDAVNALVDAFDADRSLGEWLERQLSPDDKPSFARVTRHLLDSGLVWRQLHAAEMLLRGRDTRHFPSAWNHLLARLKSGWDGPGGVSANDVRQFLYAALTDDKAPAETRENAATLLSALGERGLLLAARDGAGPGSQVARTMLQTPRR